MRGSSSPLTCRPISETMRSAPGRNASSSGGLYGIGASASRSARRRRGTRAPCSVTRRQHLAGPAARQRALLDDDEAVRLRDRRERPSSASSGAACAGRSPRPDASRASCSAASSASWTPFIADDDRHVAALAHDARLAERHRRRRSPRPRARRAACARRRAPGCRRGSPRAAAPSRPQASTARRS